MLERWGEGEGNAELTLLILVDVQSINGQF